MKLFGLRLVLLFLLLFIFIWVAAANSFSLDREAFTFTSYDLNVRVEPEQQRLGVRGKITLRNDSPTPQKIAVLQISSSLDWRSIRVGDKPLQFVSQPYTSDIDHTGALSEAVVTLPQTVDPKDTLDLDIAYEGVVVLDATRFTRIGTPSAQANSSDWDQISTKFTAVRGVGYVAWYPIATGAASLSGGTDLFEVLEQWKRREAGAEMHVKIGVSRDGLEAPAELLVNNAACSIVDAAMGGAQYLSGDCRYQPLGLVAPTFVIANYYFLDRADIAVHFLRGHEASATNFADAAERVVPFIAEWFGAPRSKAQTADLGDSNAAPFESGALLLAPLASTDHKLAGLAAAHQLTHAAFSSPRAWISEGLAHFAQALYLEHESGRQAALDYMGLHRAAFRTPESKPEKGPVPRAEDQASRSLINTADEELYRSKAMCVWWMLRDMVGDQVLKKAIAVYRPEQDKEPSYMPRLIQAQTQRDLEWFFDDWVYRVRGLPEFKVESAFTRKTLPEGYMTTITIGNLGTAGAEVPVTVKFAGGEVTKRLVVRGKSNGVIRVEAPKQPELIVVNDGSVPENNSTNNVFKVEGDAAK